MAIEAQKGYTSVQLLQHIHGGIPCEICGKISPLEETHSFVLCYAMPGGAHAAYQCDNEQHYGCCRDHALLAAFTCVFDHILDKPHAGKDEPHADDIDKIRSVTIPHMSRKEKNE